MVHKGVRASQFIEVALLGPVLQLQNLCAPPGGIAVSTNGIMMHNGISWYQSPGILKSPFCELLWEDATCFGKLLNIGSSGLQCNLSPGASRYFQGHKDLKAALQVIMSFCLPNPHSPVLWYTKGVRASHFIEVALLGPLLQLQNLCAPLGDSAVTTNGIMGFQSQGLFVSFCSL